MVSVVVCVGTGEVDFGNLTKVLVVINSLAEYRLCNSGDNETGLLSSSVISLGRCAVANERPRGMDGLTIPTLAETGRILGTLSIVEFSSVEVSDMEVIVSTVE